MDFSAVPGWAYAATAMVGLGFGLLQSYLMKRSLLGENPRRWLYLLKVLLWAAALTVIAFVSLPLLIVFTAVASLTLLVGSAFLYRKAQKEAR